MLIFVICAAACAVYFGVTLDISMRFGDDNTKTVLVRIVEAVALLAPFVASGAAQYWKLRQAGATGSRLWSLVIGTAVGAPIVGIIVMLILVFAIFGKTP